MKLPVLRDLYRSKKNFVSVKILPTARRRRHLPRPVAPSPRPVPIPHPLLWNETHFLCFVMCTFVFTSPLLRAWLVSSSPRARFHVLPGPGSRGIWPGRDDAKKILSSYLVGNREVCRLLWHPQPWCLVVVASCMLCETANTTWHWKQEHLSTSCCASDLALEKRSIPSFSQGLPYRCF
jgi:hypothetical protein